MVDVIVVIIVNIFIDYDQDIVLWFTVLFYRPHDCFWSMQSLSVLFPRLFALIVIFRFAIANARCSPTLSRTPRNHIIILARLIFLAALFPTFHLRWTSSIFIFTFRISATPPLSTIRIRVTGRFLSRLR